MNFADENRFREIANPNLAVAQVAFQKVECRQQATQFVKIIQAVDRAKILSVVTEYLKEHLEYAGLKNVHVTGRLDRVLAHHLPRQIHEHSALSSLLSNHNRKAEQFDDIHATENLRVEMHGREVKLNATILLNRMRRAARDQQQIAGTDLVALLIDLTAAAAVMEEKVD